MTKNIYSLIVIGLGVVSILLVVQTLGLKIEKVDVVKPVEIEKPVILVEEVKEVKEELPIKKEIAVEEVKTVIIPTYTPPQYIAPPVTINNTINNNPPVQEVPQVITATALVPLTQLEKAREITDYYKWYTATITYWGTNNDKIRIAYNGKSVTVDLINGWEEILRATINRIK